MIETAWPDIEKVKRPAAYGTARWSALRRTAEQAAGWTSYYSASGYARDSTYASISVVTGWPSASSAVRMAAHAHARELPEDRHERWVAALADGSIVVVRGIGCGCVEAADDSALTIYCEHAGVRVRIGRQDASRRLRPPVSARRIRAVVGTLADAPSDGRRANGYASRGRKESVIARTDPAEWIGLVRLHAAAARRHGANESASFGVLGGEVTDLLDALADELTCGADAARYERERRWLRRRFAIACASRL